MFFFFLDSTRLFISFTISIVRKYMFTFLAKKHIKGRFYYKEKCYLILECFYSYSCYIVYNWYFIMFFLDDTGNRMETYTFSLQALLLFRDKNTFLI